LDSASEGRRPSAPSSPSLGVPSAIPAIRVARKGEGRRSYSLPSASGRSRLGAPLDRRLFSVEDANPSWTFSDLGEPSPNRLDPLMFRLSSVGTPDQPLCQPMRCPSRRSLRRYETGIDLRTEGPRIALPVKAWRARAREHLPSYREPASRNPQAEPARTFYRQRSSAHRFAFSRPVPRVSGDFELPSG
jgi:hypothetical protein